MAHDNPGWCADSSLVRRGGEGVDGDPPVWGPFSNPCLDLFLDNGAMSTRRLLQVLAAAWDQDPLTALKLVCHLRAVPERYGGCGKGDREGFYAATLWMHKNHPRTLGGNVSAFAEFGYIKDLPEILYRLVRGANARQEAKKRSVATGDDDLDEPSSKRSRKLKLCTLEEEVDVVTLDPDQIEVQVEHVDLRLYDIDVEDERVEELHPPDQKKKKKAEVDQVEDSLNSEEEVEDDDMYKLLFQRKTPAAVTRLRQDA
ncbi:hypothetical protein PR202_ga08214 [Eleusine coracana subsp. coracana]|uniref:DUF2828 domain-containing protein n=1 Tax=Eleusine coracana subsp. coracana TaxID=191504 RepID=A0AAV5C0Q8_ELECO|nr:hypothetical protein PR202_ga08214 [Eleusine coracana subsp. coracana]